MYIIGGYSDGICFSGKEGGREGWEGGREGRREGVFTFFSLILSLPPSTQTSTSWT